MKSFSSPVLFKHCKNKLSAFKKTEFYVTLHKQELNIVWAGDGGKKEKKKGERS